MGGQGLAAGGPRSGGNVSPGGGTSPMGSGEKGAEGSSKKRLAKELKIKDKKRNVIEINEDSAEDGDEETVVGGGGRTLEHHGSSPGAAKSNRPDGRDDSTYRSGAKGGDRMATTTNKFSGGR